MTLRIKSGVETLILSGYAIVNCKNLLEPIQHALSKEWIKLLFQPKITAKSKTETIQYDVAKYSI